LPRWGTAPPAGNAAAAWADVNGDGWVDLLAGGSLWLNEGGQAFRAQGSPGTGVFGDHDSDGDPDLFVYAGRRLLTNDGAGHFTPVQLPEALAGACRGAIWGDLNGDSRLDLYIGGYENWEDQVTFADVVLLNGRDGFEVDFEDDRYRARGITAADFDEDGDLDIYVSNYRLQPNLLWRNDDSAGFEDVAGSHHAVATSDGFGGGHSIGSAFGDFDNDGHLDLFAGNFAHVDARSDQPKSRFLRNLGPDQDFVFEDRGECGLPYQESYASPAIGDYDNDGDLDLFFTTVYATASFGVANFPVLLRNDGDWNFVDVTEEAGLADLPATYQAAFADFDQDGDLDLAAGGKLFQNQRITPETRSQDRGKDRNWLTVELAGPPQHPIAVGAQVRVRAGSQVMVRQVESGTGEGNQNEARLHFGLGAHKGTVIVEATWLDGSHRKKRVKVNQLVVLEPDR